MTFYENAPMQLRCGDCNAIWTEDMPSGLAIHKFVALMGAIRCPSCSSKKLLMGQDRSWAEDSERMQIGFELSTIERASDWLRNGEIGNSAKAIHARMSGGQRRVDHPHDVSDLRRCLLLLRRIPEWKARMGEMAELSPEWGRLSSVWNDLTETFTGETGENWERTQAPHTAEMLRRVLGH